MPSWFLEQLNVLLSLAIPALLVCGVCAVIGSIGVCFRLGIGFANRERWGKAWLSWLYSAFISGAAFFTLYKFQLDWVVWLGVAILIIMGFFGYFLVPGHNNASGHH